MGPVAASLCWLRQRGRNFDERSWFGRHPNPVPGGNGDHCDSRWDTPANTSVATLALTLLLGADDVDRRPRQFPGQA